MANLASGIGTAAGGALGSALGPVGTALGGGLGGLVGGIFGGGSNPTPVSPYTATDAQNLNNQTSLTAAQQQQFLNQLAAQNGTQNQSAVFNQLQNVANGTGPNPAAAMLANSTGQNVANQAALMASQRGAGANAGLIARQAAMQGAATQQQAAGQGAALQANQSLNALGQLSGIAGQQVAQQQQGLNSLANTNIQQQDSVNNSIGNVNTANSGANTNNQAAANNMLNGAISGIGTNLVAGNSPTNNQNTGVSASVPSVNSSFTMPTFGSSLQSAAHGGVIKPIEMPHNGPMSHFARTLKGFTPPMMAQGGTVPVKLSPGEMVVDPKTAAKGIPQGPKVPGKAPVKGDSPKNDIVNANVEPGSVVIPRSVLESKNPHEAAAKFIAEHLKKMKAKK